MAHGWLRTQAASQRGYLTFDRLRAQGRHPTMHIEPPGSSGKEIFQSTAITEVLNRGNHQQSTQ
jgi:hypothetical protein